MHLRLIHILVFSYFYCFGTSQEVVREAYYSFDDCDMSDNGSSALDGEIIGSPLCGCGLVGNSFRFDGDNDALQIPNQVIEILSGNFTIDFYVSVEPESQIMDIISFRATCGLDSLLTIKYLPLTQEILVELAKNASSFRTIRGRINRDLCWNRITLNRSDLRYTLYIDNQRVGVVDMPEEVPFNPQSQYLIGNSPCSGSAVSGLKGRIDELRISSRPVGGVELSQSYLYPDQIINRDTTIFEGGEVFVSLGASCTQSFSWNITDGIEDPAAGPTFIRPEETTTYRLSFNDGFCTTTDTIRIYVVSTDDIECASLLLPNAFTPNGDNLNDVIGISNTFIVEDIIDFRILDRSGSVLFTSMDKNAKWDGTFKGNPMPPAVYIYQITYRCQGNEFHRTGSFAMIK